MEQNRMFEPTGLRQQPLKSKPFFLLLNIFHPELPELMVNVDRVYKYVVRIN